MVDGHLHLPDDGVAVLFDEDGERLLVENIKEELEVRATVPSGTIVSKPLGHVTIVTRMIRNVTRMVQSPNNHKYG